jgi:polysaccharide deacetylase 2 family uncharacterized protein YibQ
MRRLMLVFLVAVLTSASILVVREFYPGGHAPIALLPAAGLNVPQIQYASVSLPPLPVVPKEVVAEVKVLAPVVPPVAAKPAGTRPRIVIIIDDMGMDLVHSRQVLDLPGPLTLSFLPYAPRVAGMAAEGKARGDELMIHMPMQPINPVFDLGSIALREGMTDAEFDGMLDRAFASFSGYVGLNNHMGSKLTQDREAMAHLMRVLKAHHLLFVDSRTIAASVAVDEAAKAGLAFTTRDVFLDDIETVEAVNAQLAKLEGIARRTGNAVAIGHPYAVTVEVLRVWLPTLKGKGFDLMPVSAVATVSKD